MRAQPVRVVLLGLFLSLLVADEAPAQQPGRLQQAPGVPRFGVSGAVGVSWPVETVVSDVYGRMVPLAVQGDVRLVPHVSVFGGFKAIRQDGQSVVIGTTVAEEAYLTSLSISSLRFGATFDFPVARRLTAAASAGVGVNWYEERWPEAAATATGHPAGIVVQGEARYALHPRWAALARFEYAHIGAHAASDATTAGVNVGGFDLSAGIRVGF
ncbi:MAG: hypothetical protein ACM3NQ_21145 [Bacteroidales bacterium]